MTKPEYLARLRASRQELLAAIGAADEAALLVELEGWASDGGPFGPNTWEEDKSDLGWVVPHEREHGEALGALRPH